MHELGRDHPPEAHGDPPWILWLRMWAIMTHPVSNPFNR